MPDDLRFGERPLPETVAAAAALRRLVGQLLSLDRAHPMLAEMLTRLGEWEHDLAAVMPRDDAPRVGPRATEAQRIYLDHAFDIGGFNPCFPEYEFDRLEAGYAAGRVSFPLAYEGPPGYVHGGFLAVFFDCVTQHQNCAVRLAGKTKSLTVSYRRPTPLLRELDFEIDRSVDERGIESAARLSLGGKVLCTATVAAVGMPVESLATTRYGVRDSTARAE